MLLESYQCTEVRKPSGVQGNLVQAETGHIPVIAEFTAGFARDAFGASQPVEHYLPHVDAAVRTGNLHLWMVGDAPVAMAKTVHRSARLCRINDVYTSGEFRKQGYASSLVAELCEQVLAEGLTPVLFADGKNPDSNKVYQSIGFVQAGKIAEIKFE
ncbi:FR47-like protein [compost metagenome]